MARCRTCDVTKAYEGKKTRNKGTNYIFRLFLWFICNMCNTVRHCADCFISRHFKLRSIIKTTQWFPKVLIHAAHEKTNKTNMFSLFLTESESKEGCKNSHGHCLFICWLFLLGGAEKWEHFPLITRTNHWLSKNIWRWIEQLTTRRLISAALNQSGRIELALQNKHRWN